MKQQLENFSVCGICPINPDSDARCGPSK